MPPDEPAAGFCYEELKAEWTRFTVAAGFIVCLFEAFRTWSTGLKMKVEQRGKERLLTSLRVPTRPVRACVCACARRCACVLQLL